MADPSALQTMLAAGMDPNAASAALSGMMTGNGSTQTGAQAGQSMINAAKASNAVKATGVAQNDWFGHNLNDPNSPYYMPPVAFNPNSADAQANAANIGIVNSASTPTTAPATTPSTQTSTPKATAPATTAAPSTAASSLPPMNAGESSTAYMQRIGMTPAQIAQAQQYVANNPGATFQQATAGMTFGTPTTAPTGQPNVQPYTPGSTSPYAGQTQTTPNGIINTGALPTSGVPNGTIAPGNGIWTGINVPTVPGQPGYQLNPNIVQTTQFANPNPQYNPNYNPAAGNPLSNPDNPMNNPGYNPVTGQVQQTGADAGTVQGQLNNILTNGNPLLEAARARAIQAANARGLQNTSMAAQAGDEAMVNAALPIAQADANTFQNQNLVNQNIVNQFLSQKEGAVLNLQAAYQAFKQNNYNFDKNAQLQTYISDSNISNQQKIAALQGAISQANVWSQIQGSLAQAGMSLNAQSFMQQAGFTQQNAVNLFNAGQQNITNYANLLTQIEGSQLEPQAKLNLINTISAFFAGVPMNGVQINLGALTNTTTGTGVSNGGANAGSQPAGSGIVNGAGTGQTSGG